MEIIFKTKNGSTLWYGVQANRIVLRSDNPQDVINCLNEDASSEDVIGRKLASIILKEINRWGINDSSLS